MRLQVKILSLVSLVSIIGYVTFLGVQQLTISSKLREARNHIETQLQEQNEQRRVSLDRYLRWTLADTQVRTNMLLMKIDQYTFMKEQFLPTTKAYDKGTWFESASTMMLNPWIDFIQVENGDKVTSMFATAPPYLNGFWHFSAMEGVEVFAKYDSKGNLVGPYIGVPAWMGKDVQYAKDQMKNLDRRPEGFNFWVLFKPKDIFALDATKLEATILSNPIEPHQISVWIKSDAVYRSICEAMVANLKAIVDRLETPEAKSLYQNLTAKDAHRWLKEKLLPLKAEITKGGSIYEKLEQIDSSSLENKDIIPIRYEEMSRRWDEKRLIWELSTLFLSGVFGDNFFAGQAPDGFARTVENEPKGLGFLVEDLCFKTPFKIYDPTGISQGFDTNIEKLNQGIGIIYHPESNRLYMGNRLHLNVKDATTDKNRSGALMIGVDASNVVQQIAIATQEMTFLVMNDKVLRAYNPDGSLNQTVELTPEILGQIRQNSYGSTTDINGQEYVFFKVQPYEDMDLELFVFKLRNNEFDLLQDLAKQMKELLRSLTWQMYLFAIIISVVIVALLWFLLRSILKPISKLADAVEKVGKGEVNEPLVKKDFEGQSDELITLYTNFEEMLERIREGEKTKLVLHKFMDPAIAQKILSNEKSIHGQDVIATIFFLDFRGFTQMTEEMPADQIVTMLNQYFNEIVIILREHHGILDKFVGDAVLALWGVPEEDPKGSLFAVRAAIAIQQRLHEVNEERKKEGKIILEAAIGIHYAKVTEGIVGSHEFSEFTVIGSAVNVASRLCDEAKASEILITTNVYDLVIGQANVENLGDHHFEGITQPYTLYKVVWASKPDETVID